MGKRIIVFSAVLLFGCDSSPGEDSVGGGDSDLQLARNDSVGAKYGARGPRICSKPSITTDADSITAAMATRSFICKSEGVFSDRLYLVEDVQLEVGGGVPYTPNLGAFEAIDVTVPLYPIRGSYIKYQCSDPVTTHSGPPDTNCATYSQPNASGYCYKNTFSEWECYMADSSNDPANTRHGVAPPKP
jgi:hypothetical protein